MDELNFFEALQIAESSSFVDRERIGILSTLSVQDNSWNNNNELGQLLLVVGQVELLMFELVAQSKLILLPSGDNVFDGREV